MKLPSVISNLTRTKALIVLTCSVASVLCGMGGVCADTRISFLDVGQGDAIWVTDESGFNGLIDTGGADRLDELMAGVDAASLDSILWTCDREEHGGGIAGILHTLPVSQILYNGLFSNSGLMSRVLAAATQEMVPLVPIGRGETLDWGLNRVSVLHPDKDYGEAGENSVVVMVSRGDTNLLMMGDAGWDAEGSLLSSGQSLSAEVIKLGNHGAITSTSSSLIAAASPHAAIISAGEEPSPVVLDRLYDQAVDVYRTDLMGTICVDIGAYGYRVYPESNREIRVMFPYVVRADLPLPPDVRILNVFADGEVPLSESDEYCELINYGSPADLSGWRLNAGQEGQDVILPEGAVLGRHMRCRIYTNEVHEDSVAGCTFGSSVPVWNNSHDCGFLFDASGVLVSSFCY